MCVSFTCCNLALFPAFTENYGEVFTMRWKHPTVILNSPRAIHEGLVKNATTLTTRPPINMQASPLSDLGKPTGKLET